MSCRSLSGELQSLGEAQGVRVCVEECRRLLDLCGVPVWVRRPAVIHLLLENSLLGTISKLKPYSRFPS